MDEECVDPEGPDALRVVQAIRDALPTRVHAEMLFDQVKDLLGPAAWHETYNGGAVQVLFRRDPRDLELLLPWPLLSMGIGTGLSNIVFRSADRDPDHPRGLAPGIRGNGTGEIEVHDGPVLIGVGYGEDGWWVLPRRGGPIDTLAEAPAALARRSAHPVECLAEYVAGLDVARHGPARLILPVPHPHGARGVWEVARRRICDALFEEGIPPTATWAVADGVTGDALAWGATRAEVLSAWRAAIERRMPRPARVEAPEKMPTEEEAAAQGAMLLRGPTSDMTMPAAVPVNVPALVIPIAPPPAAAPPVGVWKRLLGSFGHTRFMAYRPDPGGFTLFGERVLTAIDFAEVEQGMDRADRAHDTPTSALRHWPEGAPPPAFWMHTYRVLDERTGKPVAPDVANAAVTREFQPFSLAADPLQDQVVRVRWVKE